MTKNILIEMMLGLFFALCVSIAVYTTASTQSGFVYQGF